MAKEAMVADLVLHSGKVLTVDSADSIQEAIAVGGNSVQAVGLDRDVLALAGPGTRVIDLRGRTVIPGIIDSHAHMDREGLKAICTPLTGLKSISDILSVVKSEVADKKPGEWVVTMPIGDPPNYSEVPGNLSEGRFPTRWELDQVSPDNPVYIRGIWTPWNIPPSVSITNSRALQLAGIDSHTPDPDPTVTIHRDANGEPNGIISDFNRFPTVEFTLMKVVPRFTHSQRVEALKESMRLYNSVGTTGVYEGHGVAPEVMRVYKEVWEGGDMTVRAHLVLSPTWTSLQKARDDMERFGYSGSGSGFGDDMLKIGGYFVQYKGLPYVARTRSAELPYTGWAGFAETYNSPSQFRRLVQMAAHYNLRVNCFVPKGMNQVLDTFEGINRKIPIANQRWTLMHASQLTHQQMSRLKNLGVILETIPLSELWLRGNRYLQDTQLADNVVSHRTYLEEGICFALGTDNKPYNPFATLWSAVARQERHTGTVLGPGQCLTRLEALRAFTLAGAYFSFDEDRRGSLERGKLADLAVLSDGFLDMPEEDIPGLRSLLTLVGGKVVHQTDAI